MSVASGAWSESRSGLRSKGDLDANLPLHSDRSSIYYNVYTLECLPVLCPSRYFSVLRRDRCSVQLRSLQPLKVERQPTSGWGGSLYRGVLTFRALCIQGWLPRRRPGPLLSTDMHTLLLLYIRQDNSRYQICQHYMAVLFHMSQSLK